MYKAMGLNFSLCCSFGHSKGHVICHILSWHNVCLVHNTKHYSVPKPMLVSHTENPMLKSSWKFSNSPLMCSQLSGLYH